MRTRSIVPAPGPYHPKQKQNRAQVGEEHRHKCVVYGAGAAAIVTLSP